MQEYHVTLHYTTEPWDEDESFSKPELYATDNRMLYSVNVGKFAEEAVADFIESADLEPKPRFYNDGKNWYPCALEVHTTDQETRSHTLERKRATALFNSHKDFSHFKTKEVILCDEPADSELGYSPIPILIKASMIADDMRSDREQGNDTPQKSIDSTTIVSDGERWYRKKCSGMSFAGICRDEGISVEDRTEENNVRRTVERYVKTNGLPMPWKK